jgi:hypothetical protein
VEVFVHSYIRSFVAAVAVLAWSAAPDAQRPSTSEPVQLPVRRVVLYKSGVGFFEHLGNVTGSADIAIQFTSGQLDDALKSLTALDLDRGTVSAISYNSVAPIDQQLAALRLPLGQDPDTMQLYRALRGTRVEVRSRSGAVAGRLLSVERRDRRRDGGTTEPIDVITIVADDGAVRSVPIESDVSVRIDERDARGDLSRYLSVIASGRGQDVRRMVISTSGTGTRRLLVSYISEVPMWKSTYRLVLPEGEGDRPLLQGWAIVDNTVGEDWTNVELSLVAGAPQSFIQRISQPLYARRPVVPLPATVQRTPQTHEATLQAGPESKAEMATGNAPAAQFAARGGGRGFGTGVAGGVVGGLPDAPAAAPAAAVAAARQQVAAETTGQELGDLFEYKLTQPVTVRKNQSALVPILSAPVDAERLSLWRGAPGSGRPLRAVWLTNATAFTLDGGSLSVIDANAFAGEGLIDPLKPGEKRLVSYGTDLGLTVSSRLDESSGRFTRVTASGGVMIAQQEERNQWVYRVRNEDTMPRTLLVEHAIRQGWTLADTPAAAETTANAARYRVQVAAKGEATLTISERRVNDTRYSIDQVDDRLIALITQRGIVPDALRRALQPVLDKRAEAAAADRQVADFTGQITAIGQDQQRVRENLQALKGSAEEKALVKRYTLQLTEQEDRLANLRQQLAEATTNRDARHVELARLIEQLTFALDAPAS